MCVRVSVCVYIFMYIYVPYVYVCVCICMRAAEAINCSYFSHTREEIYTSSSLPVTTMATLISVTIRIEIWHE